MTLTEKAYSALRLDIIRGGLAPGAPLRLAELKARYGMGFSPLREALNRLQSERLVDSEALRGFRVATLSIPEAQDAIRTRILIETEALRLSIINGGDAWETGVVSTLHALKLQVSRNDGRFDIWELETRHHAFHRALVQACGSAWMLEFFERLYTATERYRIPILLQGTRDASRDIQQEHSALADACLARNQERAISLLTTHYEHTAAMIAESGPWNSLAAAE